MENTAAQTKKSQYYQRKKDLMISILTKLAPFRDDAKTYLEQIHTQEVEESFLNSLIQRLDAALKRVNSKEHTAALTKWKEFLESMKAKEEHMRQIEEQQLSDLEAQINQL